MDNYPCPACNSRAEKKIQLTGTVGHKWIMGKFQMECSSCGRKTESYKSLVLSITDCGLSDELHRFKEKIKQESQNQERLVDLHRVNKSANINHLNN